MPAANEGLFATAGSSNRLFVKGNGVLQLAVVIAFMLGLWKKCITGALLAMHTVSVVSTWEKLIFAYSVGGLLFWAAVPVWAGLLLLWLMRDEDTLCTLKLGK